MPEKTTLKSINAFALFIDTWCQGRVLMGDEPGTPDIYATQREAEAEIVDCLEHRVEEWKVGDREVDDLMPDWMVVPITVYEDGGWATETDEGQLTPESLQDVKDRLFANLK